VTASFSSSDFQYVQQLLRERSGIVLEPGKEYLLETRLLPLVRQEKLDSISALVARLRQPSNQRLVKQVVEAMTTNETSFFRDYHPFETLRSTLLPELARRRAAERRLSIWCGAASTGQEPYSLAMLVKELGATFSGWKIEIVATDLSGDVLERAREGLYSQLEVNRGLPAPLLVKYFKQEGLSWRLAPEVRQMVAFRALNLLDSFAGLPAMDLILMRNVLIYFDLPTKQDILARLRKVLRPDGYLLLGGAETTVNIDDAYARVTFGKTVCYQKSPAPVPAGARR
jgi:chemotaxis protein methyltransferase CheR